MTGRLFPLSINISFVPWARRKINYLFTMYIKVYVIWTKNKKRFIFAVNFNLKIKDNKFHKYWIFDIELLRSNKAEQKSMPRYFNSFIHTALYWINLQISNIEFYIQLLTVYQIVYFLIYHIIIIRLLINTKYLSHEQLRHFKPSPHTYLFKWFTTINWY